MLFLTSYLIEVEYSKFMLDFPFISELLTLLLAMVAVAGIILSYIFRPTKIEVERRHSDDLKDLIKRWKSEIENLSPKSPYEVNIQEGYSLNLSVEQEIYFQDIKNHIPSNLDLLKSWNKYKKNWYEYEKNRHAFFNSIKDEVSEKIGLSWFQYSHEWNKNPGFSTRLIMNVYEDLFNIIEAKRKPYHLKEKGEFREEQGRYTFYARDGLFWSDKKDVAKKAKESYYDVLKTLSQSQHIEGAKKLISDYKRLIQEKEDVVRNLNYFAFIPLLPGKCKYIKWSLPGFKDWIKKKLGRKNQ